MFFFLFLIKIARFLLLGLGFGAVIFYLLLEGCNSVLTNATGVSSSLVSFSPLFGVSLVCRNGWGGGG